MTEVIRNDEKFYTLRTDSGIDVEVVKHDDERTSIGIFGPTTHAEIDLTDHERFLITFALSSDRDDDMLEAMFDEAFKTMRDEAEIQTFDLVVAPKDETHD